MAKKRMKLCFQRLMTVLWMCLPCRAGESKELMNGIVLMFPEKLRIEPGMELTGGRR